MRKDVNFKFITICSVKLLGFMNWNIHGFKTFSENPDIPSYLSQFDIVSLSETWTKSDEDIVDYLDTHA